MMVITNKLLRKIIKNFGVYIKNIKGKDFVVINLKIYLIKWLHTILMKGFLLFK